MKKLYFLATFLLLIFINRASAQYTASNSGNWSSPITWAPGAIPSTVCNNCTITVNSGIIVQVDAHTELKGTSILTLKDGAQLNIGNSSNTTIQTGFNIVLDTLPGNSTIVLSTVNSKIVAISAGTYDGIFVGPLSPFLFQKVVGNSPSLFLLNSIVGTAPPSYGNVLTGSHVLFSGGILPLIFSSFDATINENIANVTWSTAEESNLNRFEVLRSGDGIAWTSIGTVQAKGNTFTSTNYSFTDVSPLHGINYYRIKAIDNDLRYKFSDIRLIHGAFIKGIKFINPARSNLQVTFGSDITSNLTIRLLNLNGQVLQQKQFSNPAGETTIFPVSYYANGIYMLHIITTDGSQSIYKVVVSN